MAQRFVSVREVMTRLDLARSSAYALMDQIGAVKVGRRKRLPKSWFEAYCRRLQGTACESTADEANEILGCASGTPTSISGKATGASGDGAAPESATMGPRAADEPPSPTVELSKNLLRLAKAASLARRPSRKRSQR